MNVENVQKLIKALRSGEYKQGNNALEYQTVGDKPEYRRCCLGVACRCAMEDGVPLVVEVTGRRTIALTVAFGSHTTPLTTSFNGEVSTLPRAVAEWLGMSCNPRLVVPASVREAYPERPLPRRGRASALNDVFTLTFDQIADCFEATIEEEDE